MSVISRIDPLRLYQLRLISCGFPHHYLHFLPFLSNNKEILSVVIANFFLKILSIYAIL